MDSTGEMHAVGSIYKDVGQKQIAAAVILFLWLEEIAQRGLHREAFTSAMDPGFLADAVMANTADLSLGHTTSEATRLPGWFFLLEASCREIGNGRT